MNPSSQNQTDQTANFFWLLVLISIVILCVWFLEKHYVLLVIFWLRHSELMLVQWVLGAWNFIANLVHLPTVDTAKLAAVQHYMSTVSDKKVKFEQVAVISSYMGHFYRFPVMIILGIMAWFIYFKHSTTRFRQTYSMQSLRKQESEIWDKIKPVIGLDLVKIDLDEGPWAMAQVPLDFCKQHELLHVAEKLDQKVWAIDHGKASRIFVMQMGASFSGLNRLPIHTKALAVIFITKALRQHDIATELLDRLSASAGSGRIDYSGVEAEIQKYGDNKLVKWLIPRHAYVYGFMASLVEIARTDGVLATSEFLWLKTVDRRLWYMLNSMGRQTAVVEVAGPFAHWKAEKKLQRALRAPMIKEAVLALDGAVNNILYMTAEEKWHTSSAA